jgi:endoglucanase
MDILQVRGNRIVTAADRPFMLRGTSLGGWMNLENFINGYPGIESSLRDTFADVLGAGKADFFFQRLIHHFFTEADVKLIRECGSTVIRLPLNYRHFEADDAPFRYKEEGFALLDRALAWCEKHGLYAILDLHAVQGWQNSDWPSDNCSRHSLLWVHGHFRDRCVELWKEIARRYRGRGVVAGYDLINEPLSGAPYGRLDAHYTPSNWKLVDALYRRLVQAIREIDPEHIIFLEGDNFSKQFKGMAPPFADNLVYSGHHYNQAGLGPGPYPGRIKDVDWNREHQGQVYRAHEGTQYAREHGVPYWVGEFGSVFNGYPEEVGCRFAALDDQLAVFGEHGAHWTIWTYKDMGVMGWVTVDPESDYARTVRPVLDAKTELRADFWSWWLPPTKTDRIIDSLSEHIMEVLNDPDLDRESVTKYLRQSALYEYVGHLMQSGAAKVFKGMSEEKLDDLLSSFSLEKCVRNDRLLELMKKHLQAGNGTDRAG